MMDKIPTKKLNCGLTGGQHEYRHEKKWKRNTGMNKLVYCIGDYSSATVGCGKS